VNVHLYNASKEVPASVMIATSDVLSTANTPTLAFEGALTKNPTVGVLGDKEQTFTFKTDKPGDYLIYSGIPGLGASGMYDWLSVNANVGVPTMTTK
jgi:uncharacterized cupredoxin-like copper-binding protein